MLFTRGEYNDEINMEDIRMAGCCSSAHRSHNYICNEYISLQLQDEFRYWCRSSPWQTDLGQQGNHSVILVFLHRNTDHCNTAGGCAFLWPDREYGSVHGLAWCVMTIGSLLSIWLFMKKAGCSRISGLLFGLLCLLLSGNMIILELLYLFAGYYAIHIIAFFYVNFLKN